MNWKDIKEKYPKAWEKLRVYHNEAENIGLIDHPDIWDSDSLDKWEIRHLYDFFDEHEIYVTVDIDTIITEVLRWRYFIETSGDVIIDSDLSLSRTEAEAVAFKKAFEILETKLNK